MDTNNFPQKIGVGEREARIYSNLVAQKNFYMGHGIGRSGDVSAVQPKAAGSSLIAKLTKHLAKDAIKLCGYQNVGDVIILPLATGMALSMCLLTLRQTRPTARYVLWPRIDQKTCLKCIITGNLIPIPIENVLDGDSITTNLPYLKMKLDELGSDNILCVLSTTSCFAPRVPDNILEISLLCKASNIPHLINNAYGLQCSKIANQINLAQSKGRVDYVVQSTDKNFMVPVGGSIVFAYEKKLIKELSEIYPGRATSAPIMDLFITLLSMGREGLLRLLKERKENAKYLREKLEIFAQKHGERVLQTPRNGISFALTLGQFMNDQALEITRLGSYLYSRKVMGSRILTKSGGKLQCGMEFKNYGTHMDDYPHLPYMTVACAIGMTRVEIDVFFERLEECFKEMKNMNQ